ncbi:flagellar hook-length control protein FliK [Marinimicrobium alkaliphilum]|uniref:flagellar hook-length control protein FliK n=1 Tax=Marinimicrobium alkaliphilum TaxID=2202654 RepID=UPI000DB902F4|nr:flagellar hook-length control protein FliK [Marinimicrobium alkaliphilum]
MNGQSSLFQLLSSSGGRARSDELVKPAGRQQNDSGQAFGAQLDRAQASRRSPNGTSSPDPRSKTEAPAEKTGGRPGTAERADTAARARTESRTPAPASVTGDETALAPIESEGSETRLEALLAILGIDLEALEGIEGLEDLEGLDQWRLFEGTEDDPEALVLLSDAGELLIAQWHPEQGWQVTRAEGEQRQQLLKSLALAPPPAFRLTTTGAAESGAAVTQWVPEAPSDTLARLTELAKADANPPARGLFQQVLQAQNTSDASVTLERGGVHGPAGQEGERAERALLPGERGFVVQTEVRVPVGQNNWNQAVGDRILWLASQRVSSAELRLDPPDLGPVHVRIAINQDQANITFTSPHVGVREALDQGAARLREMFEEQGLDLVNVDIADQGAGEGDAGQAGGGQAGAGGDSANDDGEPESWVRGSLSLVDYYV